ncbi:unnamed protein product [Soboliphyme baturini]|uniref:Uncharacterized protein n=1 Tax=Soboliphyme baturini TaxID=241478 RepID=A0A183IHM4_9BILA|nr:unnamed protein product [Soboliphyme baturini]
MSAGAMVAVRVEFSNQTSLYCNILHCRSILKTIRVHRALPITVIIKMELIDQSLGDCLSLSAGNSKKMYSYVLDILRQVMLLYHTFLNLYFFNCPFWKHFTVNFMDILVLLASCCDVPKQSIKNFSRRFCTMYASLERRHFRFLRQIEYSKRDESFMSQFLLHGVC